MTLKEIQDYWNEKSNSDKPLFWIVSNNDSEDYHKFFDTGICKGLNWILNDIKVSKENKVLEIGCGVGRITIHTAKLYNEVHGIDISQKYIELANKYKKEFDINNLFYHKTDGNKFNDLEDNYFDFVYSFIVFQHFPHFWMVMNNIEEAYRVLKQDGILKFHHNRKDSINEGTISGGVSLEETDIKQLCDETGFKLIDSHKDEEYEQFHTGWWTILQK
jgi:ubiquinone/menaquinone biosynthesis C-methylase UbiE